MGAYKSLVYTDDIRRDQLMEDLVTELRIVCHPPLQRHPNIVHVLGFMWVRDQQIFANVMELDEESEELGEPREWPTVITEKAPYGSLHDFLRSKTYKDFRPSLRAKVQLCVDVLNGIEVCSLTFKFLTNDNLMQALHACDILHGDIKCKNALVYVSSTEGTAENWRVRLSDFSHSIFLSETEVKPQDIATATIPGTAIYNPPELNKPEASIQDFEQLKLSDIWRFGF